MGEQAIQSGSAAPALRRNKLSDQIYDLIYQRIVTGAYPVEHKLPTELELAHEFSASRPVVREALAALREDGVIATRQRIGNFVVGVGDGAHLRFVPLGSLTDVQKCFLFRISLEGEAAAMAAIYASEADVVAMAAAEAELERLIEAGRPSVDADYTFHLAVITAAHNRFFLTAVTSLINHVRTGMSLCRRLSVVQPELHLDQMRDEHRAVVKAVRQADAEAARAAMRNHLDASRLRVFSGQHLL
jgi:GntR family transcriptional regulator, transcriptional repressor for pyruvate dehydrogenase complex